MNVIFIRVKGSCEKILLAMSLTNTEFFVITYILCQIYFEDEFSDSSYILLYSYANPAIRAFNVAYYIQINVKDYHYFDLVVKNTVFEN